MFNQFHLSNQKILFGVHCTDQKECPKAIEAKFISDTSASASTLLAAHPGPSFVKVDTTETMDMMVVSTKVLGRRFMANFVEFLFENQSVRGRRNGRGK